MEKRLVISAAVCLEYASVFERNFIYMSNPIPANADCLCSLIEISFSKMPMMFYLLKNNIMIVKALQAEFEHEATNTRRLLQAIPDSALDYKPSEHSWTTAQLASHIAEVYNWFDGTMHQDVFEMATYKYDKGDVSKASNIVEKFEANLLVARKALEDATDDSMYKNWKMVMGGDKPVMPEMMRVQVVRGLLFNHLYHHRGEMIVYLRSTGNKVPGMYGPTYEESMPAMEAAESSEA